MLYQQKTFTLPVTTLNMSKVLFEYRMGKLTAEEYEQLTGHKPDEDKEKNET
jgi:hypothetical protein